LAVPGVHVSRRPARAGGGLSPVAYRRV